MCPTWEVQFFSPSQMMNVPAVTEEGWADTGQQTWPVLWGCFRKGPSCFENKTPNCFVWGRKKSEQINCKSLFPISPFARMLFRTDPERWALLWDTTQLLNQAASWAPGCSALTALGCWMQLWPLPRAIRAWSLWLSVFLYFHLNGLWLSESRWRQ